MADFGIFDHIGADWLPPPDNLASAVTNLSDATSVIAAFCAMKKYNKKGIFIVDNSYDVSKISSLFCALFGKDPLIFPETEFNFDTVDSFSNSADNARLSVLDKMQSGDYDVVITTVDALSMPVLAPEGVKSGSFSLKLGDTTDVDELCNILVDSGYSMFDMVEGEGSFSKRGGIVDIFVPGTKAPVRIEFFGDEIERMTYFDVLSQRRTEPCSEIKIIGNSAGLSKKSSAPLLSLLEQEYEKTKHPDIRADIEALNNGVKIASDKYIPLVTPKLYSLFDYSPDSLVFVCEYANLKKRCEFIEWQFSQNVEHSINRGMYICREGDYFLNIDLLTPHFSKNTYLFSRLPCSPGVPLSALAEADINESVVPVFDSEESVADIQSFLDRGYKCVITVRSDARLEAVTKILRNLSVSVSVNEVKNGVICVVKSDLSVSAAFNNAKLLLVSDSVVKKRDKRIKKSPDSERIKSFDDITPGDLVVHHAHGIGVYNGIKQITHNNVTKDYLVISYDKGDTLYVPCHQLDLISKYIGGERSSVKLSRLGTSAWEKAKSKVRDESKVLARELIELYAKRLKAEGFAFSPDTEWQKEFEERFEYDETDDQLECTREIKADMEKPYPMDRLLCGDVGVGKTEVALRAAFKAVSDSKQVAVLVPTTILATQHYNTMIERFRGFPVNIAVLSRFKTRAQQQKTVDDLKAGKVDIVIGTHRLLQKDIAFKDLGLLIVDEEQRFGVKHKDKIKEMSLGVDILTMSATPIPRTLNMAMSGIRDISIIEEAPSDRLPVMTYVLEYNYSIIEQAILREMRRNGCVFYLKNDIEALDRISEKLVSTIPHARILTVHGKMSATEIEKAWESVCNHEVDILLCTTIIETGIDVSFANTLIIEDADHMGLAQLHQIRGRVGRSDRRAYAYLTYKKDKVPSEIAAKRLVTIKEFTEFGAGLKIAMRDLEIRGAGSLLGERQHGNMNVVGYDTYMEILKNVILTEQGKAPEPKSECTVDVSVNAFLPASYIPSERTRIDMYKRIAAIRDKNDYNDVMEELTDRFSKPTESVVNLMRISLVRNMARKLHISDIKQKGTNLVFFFTKLDADTVNALHAVYKSQMLFTTGDKPYITLRSSDIIPKLDRMERFLETLKKIKAETV